MKQLKVKLLKKEEIKSGYFLFTLESAGLIFHPGQFVNILCRNNADFILRRPISVFSAAKETFKIFFEVKGKGTNALSQTEIGQKVDIIAPLGHGFSIKENAVLVAGGMGVAPLNFLAGKLKKANVIIGAQTKNMLFEFDLLKKHDVYIATNDGSKGFKGTAAKLLVEKLKSIKPDFIYTCGPRGMMNKIIEIAKEADIEMEASLEKYMGCGTGVCLSCVCETKSGYQRVCSEGPVFKGRELLDVRNINQEIPRQY